MGGGGGGSSEPPEPPLNPPLFIIAVNGVNVALISCTRSFTARTKPHTIIIFFLIQFYVPFKLFHSYRDESISRWGENRSTREKTTWHTRKQNMACLTYEFVPRARREPTSVR